MPCEVFLKNLGADANIGGKVKGSRGASKRIKPCRMNACTHLHQSLRPPIALSHGIKARLNGNDGK